MKTELRVGIDVGGTFTDFCVVEQQSGARQFFKERSTPDDPPRAILQGLERILADLGRKPSEVQFLAHGTTSATNMLIERKGAKTAFLTTEGFRDVLELARQARPHLFDYRIQRPAPLVRRAWRLEVRERLDADGETLVSLDKEALVEIAEHLREGGIEAIAVGFLHAHRNPAHEQAAAAVLGEFLPDTAISLSSEICPEPREFERFSTTVANAFIAPRIEGYAARLQEGLDQIGIDQPPLTISSNGGLLDLETFRAQPIRTALSGPAAGVTGAAKLASLDDGDAITFDVGGTSTDIALLHRGRPRYTADRDVAGLPVRTPMVEMEVIGAGGGSIARIDKGGALQVGPESAGASPGPVAYGMGGDKPTLTDAAATLGWLNPQGLLDGEVPLDVDAAHQAIDNDIAKPLGLSVTEAAGGIIQVAVANMARAIRSLGVRRGVDVRRATLLAYGGAGPLLAAEVAAELGIKRILIPAAPGTLCAQAMLVSDLALDLTASLFVRADDAHWSAVLERVDTLIGEGRQWLERQSAAIIEQQFEVTMEARYRGQNFEIQVETNTQELSTFLDAFHRLHKQEHGFSLSDHPVEIITARVKAIGRVRRITLQSAQSAAGVPAQRSLILGGAEHRVPVWRRAALPKTTLIGPLVIEEMSTTTIVPPDWTVVSDAKGDLMIERPES